MPIGDRDISRKFPAPFYLKISWVVYFVWKQSTNENKLRNYIILYFFWLMNKVTRARKNLMEWEHVEKFRVRGQIKRFRARVHRLNSTVRDIYPRTRDFTLRAWDFYLRAWRHVKNRAIWNQGKIEIDTLLLWSGEWGTRSCDHIRPGFFRLVH